MISGARDDDGPLYRRVARRMARAIDDGTYRVGARIPSVRGLSRQWQVSINTVLEAYRDLERQGLIAPRPQSGWFVAPRAPTAEPAESQPEADPCTVSIRELALRMAQDGRRPGVLALGAAIPDPALLPVAPLARAIRSALRAHGADCHAYAQTPGMPTYREAIARRLVEAGCTVAPDGIVAASGCLDALNLALRATCRPGDVVAVESPAYYGVLQALDALGLRVIEIPSSPRDGLNLGALRFALDEHRVAAVLVVANFANPLGSRMPDAAKRELVEMLAAREVPLIEDDIYGDLVHRGPRPVVCKAFDRPGERGLVLLCGSFSKTIGPGLRVGYVAGGRWHREICHLKSSSSFAAPTLPQLAAAELIHGGAYERHLRRVRPALARNVAAMADAVVRCFPAGTRVTRPTGGYVLWCELPAGIASLRLYDLALRARISIAPGPLFSAKQRYQGFVRLNACAWDDRRAEAIATLGRLAGKLLAKG